MDRRRFLASASRASAGGLLLRASSVAGGGALLTTTPAWAGERGRAGGDHGGAVLDDWYGVLYDACKNAGNVNVGNPPTSTPVVTPGRAARVYAVCAVAAYEALVPSAPGLRPLAGQLRDLRPSPKPGKGGVHASLVVSAAIHAAARSVLAHLNDTIRATFDAQLDEHLAQARTVSSERVIQRSLAAGRAVGEHVAAWASTDGVTAQPIGTAYTAPTGEGMWRSTPPNFGPAIDPNWGRVRTMALKSPVRSPDAHAPYSPAEGSAFWNEAQAVIANAAPWRADGQPETPEQHTAVYWRDNPGESGLPSGHWNRIVTQIALDAGWSLARSVEVLAVTAVALHDAFVSCWHEKYTSNLLRPITYINDHIDPTWKSFVNTPQFPEFTSGHSVASQAAATVLTSVAGVFEFTDRTHQRHHVSRGTRTYRSWQAAADEAANSRLQGGIHYPMGITLGMNHGELVGRTVLQRIKTRR